MRFIHLVEKILEVDLKTFSKSLPGQCEYMEEDIKNSHISWDTLWDKI